MALWDKARAEQLISGVGGIWAEKRQEATAADGDHYDT